jgi:hypothetical protein
VRQYLASIVVNPAELVDSRNLTLQRRDEMRISIASFMLIRNVENCSGWLAGTFEKLIPVSWVTGGSQILYSRRVQGNEPATGRVLES